MTAMSRPRGRRGSATSRDGRDESRSAREIEISVQLGPPLPLLAARCARPGRNGCDLHVPPPFPCGWSMVALKAAGGGPVDHMGGTGNAYTDDVGTGNN